MNEKNYEKYYKVSEEEKIEIIKKILIGNILSMCKGFDYTVDEKLNVFVNLQPCKIKSKNQESWDLRANF